QEIDEDAVLAAILVCRRAAVALDIAAEFLCCGRLVLFRIEIGRDQIGLQRAARPADAGTLEQSGDEEAVIFGRKHIHIKPWRAGLRLPVEHREIAKKREGELVAARKYYDIDLATLAVFHNYKVAVE